MDANQIGGVIGSSLGFIVLLLVFYRVIKLAIHRSKTIIEMKNDLNEMKRQLAQISNQLSASDKE